MFINIRQEGQTAEPEIRGRDFRKELEDRERVARDKRDRSRGITQNNTNLKHNQVQNQVPGHNKKMEITNECDKFIFRYD